MPMGDRVRRRVRYGDRFTERELQDGLIDLELPELAPEPATERSEPWLREADLPGHSGLRGWIERRLRRGDG